MKIIQNNPFALLGAVIILSIFLAETALGQIQNNPAGSGERPNIVIIMADDLDSRQLSCYGGQNLQTTHIDRLAREGVKFNNLIASEAMYPHVLPYLRGCTLLDTAPTKITNRSMMI